MWTCDGPTDFCWVFPLISHPSVCVYCIYTETSLDLGVHGFMYRIVSRDFVFCGCCGPGNGCIELYLVQHTATDLRDSQHGIVGVCAFLKSNLYMRSGLAERRHTAQWRKASRLRDVISSYQGAGSPRHISCFFCQATALECLLWLYQFVEDFLTLNLFVLEFQCFSLSLQEDNSLHLDWKRKRLWVMSRLPSCLITVSSAGSV